MSMEHIEQKRLGLRIKSVRVLTGLNQEEFASACGFNHTSLRNWEFGRVLPRKDAINRLINSFQSYSIFVDSDWILYGRGVGPVFSRNTTDSGFLRIGWDDEFSAFKKTCESHGYSPLVVQINDDAMLPSYHAGDWIGAISYSLNSLRELPNGSLVFNKPMLVNTTGSSYELRNVLYDGNTWWAKSKDHNLSKVCKDTVGLVVMHISAGQFDIRPHEFLKSSDREQLVQDRC